MNELNKDAQEKLQQLQIMEQSLHATLAQKQNFQAQQLEVESAISQLSGKKTAYRIIGSIMIESDAESMKKELEEKKEKIDIRIKSLDRQEEKVKSKAESLQKDVLEGMKKQ